MKYLLTGSLQTSSDLYISVLTLAVFNPDFRLGKSRGLTWQILSSAQTFIKARKVAGPEVSTSDEAFARFTRQSSAAVLKLAYQVFQLGQVPGRYDTEVERLAREGNFKAACDAAVSLGRSSFPLSLFCLPLLLKDNYASLESYLATSPALQEEFISTLDNISSGALLVPDLITAYPGIKAIGAHKLAGKPLDKMMKKYAERWALPDSVFPCSKERWAKLDLGYWIRQMFGASYSFDLQLENWREMVSSKVGDEKSLQHFLVSEVFTYNQEEGSLLAAKFGFEGFDIPEEEEEEEDWDSELRGGGPGQGSQLQQQQVVTAATGLEGWEEEEEEEALEEENFLELPIPVEEVVLVDTKEKFQGFISFLVDFTSVPGKHVGMDVEFFMKRMNLVQLAFGDKIFLLDWEFLPSEVEASAWKDLLGSLFLNKNLMIVGFGVMGDLKLLAKTVPGWSELAKQCQTVVDLERVRARLCHLLGVEPGLLRGLSGLSQSVLGRELSKAEQISDWSRRPLRPSQVSYAALDAFSCWKIYQVLQARAEERSLMVEFQEIAKEVKKPEEEKKKLTPGEARARLAACVPNLARPLFQEVRQPGQVRLVCDDMLQGLSRRLRVLGLDCLALGNGQDHLDCVRLCRDSPEERYVVSRGAAAAAISRRLPAGHTLSLRSNEVELQLEEVFQYFNIALDATKVLPRCAACNGAHHYDLSSSIIQAIQDNILERLHTRQANLVIHCEEDSEEDEFGEDWGEEFLEEEVVRRWETVQVLSSLTGEERRGQINLFTACTETGTKLQVEHLALQPSQEGQAFWACADCGKIRAKALIWCVHFTQ